MQYCNVETYNILNLLDSKTKKVSRCMFRIFIRFNWIWLTQISEQAEVAEMWHISHVSDQPIHLYRGMN